MRRRPGIRITSAKPVEELIADLRRHAGATNASLQKLKSEYCALTPEQARDLAAAVGAGDAEYQIAMTFSPKLNSDFSLGELLAKIPPAAEKSRARFGIAELSPQASSRDVY